MSDKTGIEWARGDDGTAGATWNPVTGCTKVSAGCDHCYAETFAERWRGVPGHHFERGFDVTLRPERLDQPLRWKRPRRIFVNSMSDLFHQDVPDERGQVKAERELAGYREKAEAQIARLEERLAEAVAQRDSAASPRVAELERRNAELGEGVREQKAEAEAALRVQRTVTTSFHRYLVNVGKLTPVEAIEIILSLAPGADRAYHVMSSKVKTELIDSQDDKALAVDLAVGAARGRRRRSHVVGQMLAELEADGLL